MLWIDDTRPFWHPLLTVQLYGFAIAYCVNVAAPWDNDHADPPARRCAVAVGALIGVVLVILVKGYPRRLRARARDVLRCTTSFAAFVNGLFVSLFFYVKFREARAAAALHKAEAERHLLSKQAIEAELKLMQAQVEPHFLFNTLASVQYLTETDPQQASVLLGHLIDYLRAALPQLRARSTTLGQGSRRSREAYLNILQMRMGARLAFAIDVPAELRDASVSAEPADLARRERDQARHRAVGRRRHGRRSPRAATATRVVVTVDRHRPRARGARRRAGQGVGLVNVRERLAALYGARGRFTLEPIDAARRARDARRCRSKPPPDAPDRCPPRSSPRTSRCCARS